MTDDIQTWRTGRTTEMILPCGLTVHVKKVTLLDLAVRGQIPTPLIGDVEAILQNGLHFAVADLKESFAAVDLVVKAAVVSPPLADEPSNEAIGIHEIPANDRLEIYMWAKEEASKLATFPGRQNERTASAQPGAGVPHATE